MINHPRAAVVGGMLEPMLQARGVLRQGEGMRVAIIRSNNASGVSHADKVLSLLHWNGKSAAENGDLVRQFVVPDELERKGKTDALDVMADSVAAFAPHVVIEAGADQGPFVAIERRWLPKTKFRPNYVTSGQLGDPDLEKLVHDRPDALRRLFSINSTIPPAMTKFIMHHNEIFTDEKINPFNCSSAPYDAFYTAAYAIVALGDEPITGKGLSRSVRRLVPPGEPIIASCKETRARRGATRHFVKYAFEFRHEGDVCYEGEQSALWTKVTEDAEVRADDEMGMA